MNPDDLTAFLTQNFADVSIIKDAGDTHFFYNPANDPAAQKFPFATLVTSDAHDQASDLKRPGVFRLNLGVSPATYRARFGSPPKPTREFEVVTTGHDFTALDQILPHPIYAPMSWICILNPSPETFKALHPLLEEAHQLAARRYIAR